MHLLVLALRNLTRHTRRTLITALAVAFGTAAVVLLQGVANGFVKHIIENSVLNKVGAVQVFRRGYLGADDPLAMAFLQDETLLARIRAVPGVTEVAPRLDFDGLMSNGSDATMFVATAIDPTLEYRVCPRRATYLAPGSRPLGPRDERRAIIGKQLVESLGASEGSTLVMQAAGPHAGTNALDVAVHGFLPHTHPVESKRLATVPLPFAQELLRMPGQITEYVVGVADLGRVDAVARAVQTALGDGFEVTTWRQIDIGTRDRAPLLQYILDFIALVLFLLVSTGIVNTMTMSVHERVREIGTLLAVGVRRWQITALFLLEAAAIGVGSALLGTAGGFVLVQLVARHGVQGGVGGDVIVVRPFVGPSFLALVFVLTVVGTVLAALYPTWKAARLRPVEALRST